MDLWWVQTLCHEWMGQAYAEFLSKANDGEKNAQEWLAQVSALSEQLLFSRPGREAVEAPHDDLLSKHMQSGA